MAITVPIYGQQQVAVRARPNMTLPEAAAGSPDAYGAGLGRGVSELAQASADIYHQGTVAAVQQAQADFGDRNLERQQQFLTLSGKDALAAQTKFQSDAASDAMGVRNKLPSDAARNMWDVWAPHALNQYSAAIVAHSSAQGEQLSKASFSASLEQLHKQIGLNYTDPSQIADGIKGLNTSVTTYAEAHGWSPEMTAQALDDQHSRAYGTVIVNSLDANDWKRAVATFHDGMTNRVFTPEAEHQLRGIITPAEIRGRAHEASAQVLGPTPVASGITAAQAVAQAEELTKDQTPEVQQAAKERTLRDLSEAYSIHSETQNMGMAAVLKDALQNGKTWDDVADKPNVLALDPMTRIRLQHDLAKEVDPYQSRIAFHTWKMLISSQDEKTRNKAIDAGPQMFPGMNKEDMLSAIDLWYTARDSISGTSSAGPARKELDSVYTKGEAISRVLTSAGLSMQKQSDGSYDPDTAAALDWIDREGKGMQANRKDRAPLTSDDWSVIANKAVAKQVVLKRFWYNYLTGGVGETKMSNYQLGAEQVKEIPQEQQAMIRERFNAFNRRMPTDIELYQQWNMDGRPGSPPSKQPTGSVEPGTRPEETPRDRAVREAMLLPHHVQIGSREAAGIIARTKTVQENLVEAIAQGINVEANTKLLIEIRNALHDAPVTVRDAAGSSIPVRFSSGIHGELRQENAQDSLSGVRPTSATPEQEKAYQEWLDRHPDQRFVNDLLEQKRYRLPDNMQPWNQ